jgi:hypothetical protein
LAERLLGIERVDGLAKWRRLAGEGAARPVLVYGGDARQSREAAEVLPLIGALAKETARPVWSLDAEVGRRSGLEFVDLDQPWGRPPEGSAREKFLEHLGARQA